MKVDLFIPCFVTIRCRRRWAWRWPACSRGSVHSCEFRSGPDLLRPAEFQCRRIGTRPVSVAIRAIEVLRRGRGGRRPERIVRGDDAGLLSTARLAGTDHETAALDLASRTFEFGEFLVTKLGVTDVGAPLSAHRHLPRRLPRPAGTADQGGAAATPAGGPRPDARRMLMSPKAAAGFGGLFSVKFPMISTAMVSAEVKGAARSLALAGRPTSSRAIRAASCSSMAGSHATAARLRAGRRGRSIWRRCWRRNDAVIHCRWRRGGSAAARAARASSRWRHRPPASGRRGPFSSRHRAAVRQERRSHVEPQRRGPVIRSDSGNGAIDQAMRIRGPRARPRQRDQAEGAARSSCRRSAAAASSSSPNGRAPIASRVSTSTAPKMIRNATAKAIDSRAFRQRQQIFEFAGKPQRSDGGDEHLHSRQRRQKGTLLPSRTAPCPRSPSPRRGRRSVAAQLILVTRATSSMYSSRRPPPYRGPIAGAWSHAGLPAGGPRRSPGSMAAPPTALTNGVVDHHRLGEMPVRPRVARPHGTPRSPSSR